MNSERQDQLAKIASDIVYAWMGSEIGALDKTDRINLRNAVSESVGPLMDEIERLRAAIHDHKMHVKIDTHPANGPSLFDEVLWKAIEGSDDEQ